MEWNIIKESLQKLHRCLPLPLFFFPCLRCCKEDILSLFCRAASTCTYVFQKGLWFEFSFLPRVVAVERAGNKHRGWAQHPPDAINRQAYNHDRNQFSKSGTVSTAALLSYLRLCIISFWFHYSFSFSLQPALPFQPSSHHISSLLIRKRS